MRGREERRCRSLSALLAPVTTLFPPSLPLPLFYLSFRRTCTCWTQLAPSRRNRPRSLEPAMRTPAAWRTAATFTRAVAVQMRRSRALRGQPPVPPRGARASCRTSAPAPPPKSGARPSAVGAGERRARAREGGGGEDGARAQGRAKGSRAPTTTAVRPPRAHARALLPLRGRGWWAERTERAAAAAPPIASSPPSKRMHARASYGSREGAE